MFPRVLKAISLATSAVLVGAILTVASFVTPPTTTDVAAEAAPPASAFDPGLIISDSVMFDFGALSLDGIQAFLDSKVTSCSSSASAPCLKDYHVDTHDIAAVTNRCTGNITGAANQSAAQVIFAVSQACQVNPKVLLVTLQKEQGLVTSTSPTDGKYKIAMGYGCPDTAPCDSTYYGFFNQVYQAAYAFNKYTKSPDQYPAYQPGVRKIGYNPKSACGTATVNIESKATGALYFYTPYVPNAAALANPYGVGDSCSSYGNRNFWVYFNDWFGSPVGGSFLIDTASGHTYLLVNGTKWELPSARVPALLKTLAPLGVVGRVSQAYANSFPSGATLNNLVVGSTGQLYLLDNGHRYTVSDCTQAADFGFACSTAPVLTDDMLAFFPTAGAMTAYATTTAGARFVLGGGQKREVLDAASVAAAGITLAAPTTVADDTLASVPYGAPIVKPNSLIGVRGSTDQVWVDQGASYRMTASLLSQAGLVAKLGGTAGVLDAASFTLLPPALAFHGLFTIPSSGLTYVVSSAGVVHVTDPKEWGATFPAVDPVFAAQLGAATSTVSAPLFIKDQAASVRFYLSAGKTRPLATNAQVKALAKKAHVATTARALPSEVVAAIGKPLVKPASVVKATKKSTAYWFIDGSHKKRSVTAKQAKELTGSATAKVVAAATIAGFSTVSGGAKLGLRSGTVYYLADGGYLRPVAASAVKQFGSKFGFGSYDATTIAALKHGAAAGRIIKYGAKYYNVTNGKKVHVSAASAKKLAAAAGVKIQPVSKYLASLLVTK